MDITKTVPFHIHKRLVAFEQGDHTVQSRQSGRRCQPTEPTADHSHLIPRLDQATLVDRPHQIERAMLLRRETDATHLWSDQKHASRPDGGGAQNLVDRGTVGQR
ncbi:hypothetical protein [Sphingobium yanoikuyae]|uniref:hypothetical protein n=1 Tax=Sphingobium yanoikuyae TaxID=13690 RepID=UPI001F48E42C|nr:hypothetical protein [Sphingobium yanoikuyae]